MLATHLIAARCLRVTRYSLGVQGLKDQPAPILDREADQVLGHARKGIIQKELGNDKYHQQEDNDHQQCGEASTKPGQMSARCWCAAGEGATGLYS